MPMKPFAIISFFIFIVLFTSCSSDNGNFYVKAPTGWIVVDTTQGFRKFVKMHPPAISSTPQFVENINISILKFPSLDIYIKTVLSDIKRDASYFESKGKGLVKINGYNVRWQQHVIQLKNSDTLEQKVFFTTDKGNIYQLVYTTKVNEIDKYQLELNEIFKSFKIL